MLTLLKVNFPFCQRLTVDAVILLQAIIILANSMANLEMSPEYKCCPLCDKHVIAMCPPAMKDKFHLYSQSFHKIALRVAQRKVNPYLPSDLCDYVY